VTVDMGAPLEQAVRSAFRGLTDAGVPPAAARSRT
jgi:hypothetical protein